MVLEEGIKIILMVLLLLVVVYLAWNAFFGGGGKILAGIRNSFRWGRA